MKNLNKVEAKKLFENIDLYSSLNAENCSDLSEVNKPQVEYIDEGALDWDFEHVSKIEDEEENLIYEA